MAATADKRHGHAVFSERVATGGRVSHVSVVATVVVSGGVGQVLLPRMPRLMT